MAITENVSSAVDARVPGKLPIRVLTIAAAYIALETIARIALATRLDGLAWSRDWQAIAMALVIGALRDVAVATILLAPLYWLLASWHRPWRNAIIRAVLQLLIAGGMCLFVFDSVAEIFFWEEFASRFNGIAVNYLIFPREVIGNLRESFELGLYLPLVFLFGLLLWRLIYRSMRKAMSPAISRPGFLQASLHTAVACMLAIAVLNFLPRDIADDREINELAENDLITMALAAWTNVQDYEGVYPSMDPAEALAITKQILAQDNTRYLDPADALSIRRFVDNGTTPQKLNIVMVTEESFGSDYVTGLDSANPVPVSPNLERLSHEGVWFTNIYASGDRTVRGLEATETSFEPIPGISTARRPESEGMYSLPWLLAQHGYKSGVLYGGFNGFDNMGAFWRGIGFDRAWDQRDIRHDGFSTIWGVSDEDLFTEALQRMDENAKPGQPFLLTMMTVSNHRPFKFPEHFKTRDDFTRRENGAAYADWAFNDLIERARSHSWFDDTVFIFVADHGQKVNGRAQVPMEKFRIPVLFYSPKHLPPRRINTLGAQIDLAPTLLGMLGFSYESPFFGMDLTRVPPDKGRVAAAHNFSIGYVEGDHAVTLEPNGTLKGYAFRKGYFPLKPGPVDQEVARRAIALTQTAHRMFYAHRYHQDVAVQVN